MSHKATVTAAATVKDDTPMRCPHCKRQGFFRIGQYSWNVQDFDCESEDWDSSDYGEGDLATDAKCGHCDRDVTDYLLRRGWTFVHDVEIPRNTHRRLTAEERYRILPHTGDDDLIAIRVGQLKTELGRLLDEQEFRRRRAEKAKRLEQAVYP